MLFNPFWKRHGNGLSFSKPGSGPPLCHRVCWHQPGPSRGDDGWRGGGSFQETMPKMQRPLSVPGLEGSLCPLASWVLWLRRHDDLQGKKNEESVICLGWSVWGSRGSDTQQSWESHVIVPDPRLAPGSQRETGQVPMTLALHSSSFPPGLGPTAAGSGHGDT